MDERGASKEFQADRAEASRRYRVTFVHLGDWAGVEIPVCAEDPEQAWDRAALILAQRVGRTAMVEEWQHAQTVAE